MEIAQSYLSNLLAMTSALPLLESEDTGVHGKPFNFQECQVKELIFLGEVCTQLRT